MKVKFIYFDVKQCVSYYNKLVNSNFINFLLFNSEFKRAVKLNEIVYSRDINIESILLYKVSKKLYHIKIIISSFHSYIRELKPIIINTNIKCECSFNNNCISIDLLNGLVYIPIDANIQTINIKNTEQIRIDLAK